jgi:putative acetyltransferase
VEAEFTRYRRLAEAALGQLEDADLARADAGGNSVAVICWHVGGNLHSRFTDFLTSDGEKPWRRREEEFERRAVSRSELLAHWEEGWAALRDTLAHLTDADLGRTVTIRGQPLRVIEALHRALAHVSYHVGQVVALARQLRGEAWRFLSIPPGQSEQYNARPTMEKPAAHAGSLVPIRIVEGGLDDPRVVALLQTHVARARAETAPGSAHALDLSGLRAPEVTFWSAWEGDALVGVGALKQLSADHGEIKSMHTAESARGRGVGSAILREIVGRARARKMSRLSLETGSWPYFAAARALYARNGFTECPPFGDYREDPNSVFMTRALGPD